MRAKTNSRSARLLAAAVTALALTAGGLLVASPASAHDELVSTDPATGATVDCAPRADHSDLCRGLL